MLTRSWFTALRDARLASYALAVFAAILMLFAVPARADTITQTFAGVAAPASTLGLNPFNPTLGTLVSISDSVTFTGIVPEGDIGSEIVTFGTIPNTFSQPTACLAPAGCAFTGFTIFDTGITDPSVLPEFLTAFNQTFTTTGTVTGASVSGSLTYTYTPASTAAPEPDSRSLLLIGIGMIWVVTRKRRTEGLALSTEAP
jgi:hypothetical protein